MTVFRWSTTAATNATADSTVNARENQAPSTVNDAMRGMMAAVAKWRNDLSGVTTTAGTSTAYTATSGQGYSSLANGITITLRMSATNGAAPTLNVDGLGAAAIHAVAGTAVAAGALLSGGIYSFTYVSGSSAWVVNGQDALATVARTDSNFIVGNGTTFVAESGATARTSLGLGTGDSPQFTAIELGNASDTTLSRAAAGRLAVEGVNVVTISSTDTLTNKTINLANNTLTATSAQIAAAVTDETGTGALVFATSPTLTTPNLGTPSAATLTNATGLPVATGISGLGSGVATFLATPSSANLAAAVTGETGTGALVFGTSPTIASPTLTAPVLGTPASGTLTNCTGLPIDAGTTGTLPVARGGTGVTTSTGTGSVVLSASPALTGTPTAPTAAVATNNTQVATTGFVRSNVLTGEIKAYVGTAAPAGYVRANGRTIGNAASGASERANADTADLYTLLWNSYADGVCAVSSGRGASAAADYAANKTIALPDLRGRGLFGLDDMGNSAANRLAAATIDQTTNGASGGADTVTLLEANLPAHTHGAGTLATASNGAHTHTITENFFREDNNNSGGSANALRESQGAAGSYTLTTDSQGAHTHTISGDTGSTGSGTAIDKLPPCFLTTFIIKL